MVIVCPYYPTPFTAGWLVVFHMVDMMEDMDGRYIDSMNTPFHSDIDIDIDIDIAL